MLISAPPISLTCPLQLGLANKDLSIGLCFRYTEEIVTRFCTFQIILTLLDGINFF